MPLDKISIPSRKLSGKPTEKSKLRSSWLLSTRLISKLETDIGLTLKPVSGKVKDTPKDALILHTA